MLLNEYKPQNIPFATLYLLFSILTLFTKQEDDSFPVVKTHHIWVNKDFHANATKSISLEHTKLGEINIILKNDNDNPIFVENVLASLYLEKADKEPLEFAGIENIMQDVAANGSLNINFKFSPENEIPEVFYFCKVEITLRHKDESFKQIVAFDKVNVIEKPSSIFDVQNLIALGVFIMLLGMILWGCYKIIVVRLLGYEHKIEWKSKKKPERKKVETNMNDWLPKSIRLS